MEEEGQWTYWINSNTPIKDQEGTTLDTLVELCVSSYNLKSKSRKANLKNQVHFFLEWWKEHRHLMKKYRNQSRIGRHLGIDHATVSHYIGRAGKPGLRKKTADFEENTKCINDYLNS